MIALFEAFWPHVRRETTTERAEETLARLSDLAAIKNCDWEKETEVALDQARLLAEQESDRKRSAENKASIYLAVIAAIVPVLASLLTDFFNDGFSALALAFRTISIILFVLGTLYLIMSGVWAFRTLSVSTHARVDAADLVAAWQMPKPSTRLISELLSATRYNRSGVNKKMDYIWLAQEFLLRTFLCFAALMVVIVMREPIQAMIEMFAPYFGNVTRWLANMLHC